MSKRIRCLLVGPLTKGEGYSGEDAYTQALLSHPPSDVDYIFHEDLVANGQGARVKWMHALFGILSEYHLGILPYNWLQTLETNLDFDIIHVHAWQVFFGRQMRSKGMPVVISSSSDPTYGLKSYKGWTDSRIRRHRLVSRVLQRALHVQDSYFNPGPAQRILVWSEFARADYVQAGLDPARLCVVPPGISDPGHRATPGSMDSFRILFVGNDFERKGGQELVKVFQGLYHEFGPRVQLTIVSSRFPPSDDRSGVTFAGRVDRQEIHSLYAQSDVFVLPSHAEGYGMSVVEAMSFGLPVIVSAVGALPSIVTGHTGHVIHSEQELSEALHTLIMNPAYCARLGENAYRHFKLNFEIGITNRRLREVYDAVVG